MMQMDTVLITAWTDCLTARSIMMPMVSMRDSARRISSRGAPFMVRMGRSIQGCSIMGMLSGTTMPVQIERIDNRRSFFVAEEL